jgi:alcohol dehydrogenase class IV
MGGLAFQKNLGAVHSLSHPLGAFGEHGLHHGTLNALFLPPLDCSLHCQGRFSP